MISRWLIGCSLSFTLKMPLFWGTHSPFGSQWQTRGFTVSGAMLPLWNIYVLTAGILSGIYQLHSQPPWYYHRRAVRDDGRRIILIPCLNPCIMSDADDCPPCMHCLRFLVEPLSNYRLPWIILSSSSIHLSMSQRSPACLYLDSLIMTPKDVIAIYNRMQLKCNPIKQTVDTTALESTGEVGGGKKAIYSVKTHKVLWMEGREN